MMGSDAQVAEATPHESTCDETTQVMDSSLKSGLPTTVKGSEDHFNPDQAAALLRELDGQEDPTGRKRKSSGNLECGENDAKKMRLQMDKTVDSRRDPHASIDRARQLPAEIWHHVFTYLPPRTLGRLLLVNKLFHNYLSPSPVVSCPPLSFTPPSFLQSLKPDAIWRASRRSFWSRMPAPLQDKSEPDMWRLACSSRCQFCHCQSDSQAVEDDWHRGPGAKGVSFVIPFSIVSCGNCLVSKSLKVYPLPSNVHHPICCLPCSLGD